MPAATRTEPDDRLVPYILTGPWKESGDGNLIELIVPSSVVPASFAWLIYAQDFIRTELGVCADDYSGQGGVSVAGRVVRAGGRMEGIMAIQVKGNENIEQLRKGLRHYPQEKRPVFEAEVAREATRHHL